ncbi:MAG: glycosyltransferase family 4 protein [Deltaproteobacteria bacterium]|nr:glycosyltransferase family 4 protein [Deltaproteobacteria bacterium]
MRLALIYDRTKGGLTKTALLTSIALAERGHSVLVCGPARRLPPLAKRAQDLGVMFTEGPEGGFLTLPQPIARKMKEFGPDLIVSSHRGCDVRASHLARKLRIPHVAWIHGDPNSADGLQNPGIPLLGFRNHLWRQALRRARRIVCVSSKVMESTTEFLGGDRDEKVSSVLNAISLADYSWARPKGLREDGRPIRLLAVGRVCREKRPHLLVDLVQRARDLGWNVTGQWLGEGELLDEVRDRVARLHMSSFIDLPGHRWDVVRFYRDADIQVHFCTDEGCSLALAEAQAAGLPVVAFNSGSIPEIVQHGVTGLLSPPLDTEQMVARIKALKDNTKLYTAMSAAAIDWARSRFSHERLGFEFEKTLLGALAE